MAHPLHTIPDFEGHPFGTIDDDLVILLRLTAQRIGNKLINLFHIVPRTVRCSEDEREGDIPVVGM